MKQNSASHVNSGRRMEYEAMTASIILLFNREYPRADRKRKNEHMYVRSRERERVRDRADIFDGVLFSYFRLVRETSAASRDTLGFRRPLTSTVPAGLHHGPQ